MESMPYVSSAIPQKFYTPLRKWLNDLAFKNHNQSPAMHISGMLALSIAVSYCQPELTEERLVAMLKTFGANNLEILEFKHMMNEVKNKIQGKNNA